MARGKKVPTPPVEMAMVAPLLQEIRTRPTASLGDFEVVS